MNSHIPRLAPQSSAYTISAPYFIPTLPAARAKQNRTQVPLPGAGQWGRAGGFGAQPCHGCTHRRQEAMAAKGPLLGRAWGGVLTARAWAWGAQGTEAQGGFGMGNPHCSGLMPCAASGAAAAKGTALPQAASCLLACSPDFCQFGRGTAALINAAQLARELATSPLPPATCRSGLQLCSPPLCSPPASPITSRQEQMRPGVHQSRHTPLNVNGDSHVQRGSGLSANRGTTLYCQGSLKQRLPASIALHTRVEKAVKAEEGPDRDCVGRGVSAGADGCHLPTPALPNSR